MSNKEKHSELKMQFCNISKNNNDPTLIEATLIVHDFLKSENNQVITEEICEENKSTLIGKRIVCKYIKAEDNDGKDSFVDHCEAISTDRYGNETIITETEAIGFITDAYIDDYTDENGNVTRVLYAKATLWNDEKYSDIVGLIQEWLSRGIKVDMSCEYLYVNYSVENGIEYIQSPIIYTGHCILNSENRNAYEKIEPAYKVAGILSLNDIKSWNTALNKIKSLNKKENDEMENTMFEFLKSINAISAGDLKWKLYDALAKVMVAEEYNSMYISTYDIYPTENYFLYDSWVGESYKLYKVNYLVDENDLVTVDYDNKVEVEYKYSITEVENVKTSLNEKTKEVEKLEKSLNTKEIEVKTVKEDLGTKLTESNELVISLNSKINVLNAEIETLQPIVEKYQKEEYEKALNSVTEKYKEKFENAGALEVFNEETTQELLKKSINSVDLKEDKECISSLNQLIVDNIKIKDIETPGQKSINSVVPAKENKNLSDNFTDLYEEYSGISK